MFRLGDFIIYVFLLISTYEAGIKKYRRRLWTDHFEIIPRSLCLLSQKNASHAKICVYDPWIRSGAVHYIRKSTAIFEI